MNQQIIADLNWRYATKKFDSTKKISKKDLDTLLNVLRLVPTSCGLQSLSYLVVNDDVIRERLKVASGNQSQLVDASHVIIFCAHTDTPDSYIDYLVHLTAEARELELESLNGFSSFLKSSVSKLSPKELLEWNSKQAYIALGMLLHATASLRIDSTPMEGFDPVKYDEILGLTEKGLKAVLVCPLGYRSEEDGYQHLKKVRKPLDKYVLYI